MTSGSPRVRNVGLTRVAAIVAALTIASFAFPRRMAHSRPEP